MGKNKDKKEHLPYHIVKDGQNSLRLKLKELKSGVGKIPRRMLSSMIIILGIFAVVLIALFTGQQGVTDRNLTDNQGSLDVVVDDTGHLQARVPEAPEFKLDGNGLNLEGDTSESVPAETTAGVTTEPEAVESVPVAKLTTTYPLNRRGVIITDYGWYYHPVYEVWRYHPGVDIRCKKGETVLAAASGQVIAVADREQEGVFVTIDHGNNWTTIYGQIDESTAKVGDRVEKGQKIGMIGQSVSAIEPHLHFEIRKTEDSVNPDEYLE